MFNFASLSDKTATALAEFTLPKIFTSATAIIIYLFIILSLIAVLVIATAVSLFTASTFFSVLGWTALATAVVMAIDGLTATLCQFLPEKLANHERKLFVVSATKRSFTKS